MSEDQIKRLLFAKGPIGVNVADSSGRRHSGILLTVGREDGSGQSFNITLLTKEGHETFHVRTTC